MKLFWRNYPWSPLPNFQVQGTMENGKYGSSWGKVVVNTFKIYNLKIRKWFMKQKQNTVQLMKSMGI